MFNSVNLKSIVLEFCDESIIIGFGKCPSPRWTIPFVSESNNEHLARAKFTSILQTIFNDYLHLRARSSQVVVIEPFLWPRITRDALYNSLLFDFQVPMISFQPRAHMAAIATGVSVGMLVHVGKKDADIVCFGDSRPIISTTSSISFSHSESTEDEERICDISDIILNSLRSAPVDLRKNLAKNIVVYGDCSEVARLKDKILESLVSRHSEYLVPVQFQLHDLLFPVDLLAWTGGSIFSTLPNNQARYISRDTVSYSSISTSSGIEGLNNEVHAPDWLSTNKKDWIFLGSIEA